jgi:23S rRNA (uracil1939-C5)-methyltransferase
VTSCQHFGECGGCTLQHIAYPEQLRLKTALVDRLVRAAVPGAPAARPMLPSTPLDSPWGYRSKVHFVFGGQAMGHYARGSRRVIAVRECPVHDPRGNDVAFAFRDALVPGLRATHASPLQGIAIRVGANTGETMATLVVTSDGDRRVRTASRKAVAESQPTSFHVNVHPKRDGFVFGPHTRRIAGPERMREEVAGVSFLISPTAFFQTNIAAAEILVKLVLDGVGAMHASPPPRTATDVVGATHASPVNVLDLYAGAGLFALPLARAGHTVTAVEENREAVADGEASQRFNRIPASRCRFIVSPVEKWRTRGSFGVVILDPPREGCTPHVIDHVFGGLRPGSAIYISCNPEALARDLASIVVHGYAIQSLQPVDMFPHTEHVETVVTLRAMTQ